MAKNMFNVNRVAYGQFTFPTNTAGNTASTLSASCNVHIPKGAIVTGIRYFALGALTNVANLGTVSINLLVGTGAQVLGTNNLVASAALIATNAISQVVVTNAGVYVSVGGNLIINFGSSSSARTGVAGTADVYVDYLYCADRDIT